MLELLIYITGVILVLILGVIFMVFYEDCDIEDASLMVVTISTLSWVSIISIIILLTIFSLHELVYKFTCYIKTKKGL